MTKPQNTDSIAAATGISWNDWVTFLDAQHAHELSHAEIARIAHKHISSQLKSAGWWAQGVAVAYEQSIGRRKAGQRTDGTFEVAVSRTVARARDEAFQTVVKAVEVYIETSALETNNVRTSHTPKRSYWKCDVKNSGTVTVSTELKTTDAIKSLCVITHAKLRAADEAARWKATWATLLADLP